MHFATPAAPNTWDIDLTGDLSPGQSIFFSLDTTLNTARALVRTADLPFGPDTFLGPVGEMRSASLTHELALTAHGIFGPHVGPTFTPASPLYMSTVPEPATVLPFFFAAIALLLRRASFHE